MSEDITPKEGLNELNNIHNPSPEESNYNSLTINEKQLSQQTTENGNLFLFRETIKNTFEKTISGVSEEKFAEWLKEISIIKKKRNIALKLYHSFKKSVLDRAIYQLDIMIEEEKLEEKFAAYSRLIEEDNLNIENVAWRPPGDVKLHLRSHFILAKMKRKQEFEQFVISKELEVQSLQNEVTLKRNKMKRIEAKLKEMDKRNKENVIQLEQVKNELLKPIITDLIK